MKMKINHAYLASLAVAFFTAIAGFSQTSSDAGFSYYGKLRLGSLMYDNANNESYQEEFSPSYGLHFAIQYKKERWGLETGVGVDALNFNQLFMNRRESAIKENRDVSLKYGAFSVPLFIGYDLSDRFELIAGYNMIAAQWSSVKVSVSSSQAGSTASSFQMIDNAPDWQFTHEAVMGLRFKIADQFSVGMLAAKSLDDLDGGSSRWLTVGQGAPNTTDQFSYSWYRFSVELTYKINK